ncbi:MAG: DUF5107 domain-containing protein [Burkholderiales bacterium]|nr:DUF5107 domain-containing protein [Anaerolineae bacterium]
MSNAIKVSSTTFKSWAAVVLENDFASMTVLPEIGGKVVSIKALPTNREFLWQDDTRPYRLPQYGNIFGSYDASGFDDCFPTIGECLYPEFPWEGITVPDHGEMWCTSWLCELQETGVYLHAYGVRFPYHFEKWITLSPDAGTFSIAYCVSNLASYDFKYSWAAHPLFAACEGMRILLPGQPETRFVFAIGDRIGGEFLETHRWPWMRTPSGDPVDYSVIGSPSLAANDKVYADVGDAGWCALHHPESGDFIGFRFSPEKLPYLGICINHGAYPFEGVKGFWVALEPCTGYPDPLDQVIALQKHATLKGRGSAEWSLTLLLGQADSDEAVRQIMS